MILSNIEMKRIPLISATEPTATKLSFNMEETKSHNTIAMDNAPTRVTSFADIKILNDNEAEIKRLQKENSFLNKILDALFPEKISEEENYPMSQTREPVIPTTHLIPISRYPELVQEPVILSLEKNKLSKFVDLELPSPKTSFKRHRNKNVQEENKFAAKKDTSELFRQFSSLSEIKDMMQTDPTYFTRMQGLTNLRKSFPPIVG